MRRHEKYRNEKSSGVRTCFYTKENKDKKKRYIYMRNEREVKINGTFKRVENEKKKQLNEAMYCTRKIMIAKERYTDKENDLNRVQESSEDENKIEKIKKSKL